MRVSDKMRINQVNKNINRNRTEMSELQSQAATLKRVTKPSDDAIAASRVLAGRVEDKGYGQFIKNIFNAKSFLEFSEQGLGQLGDALTRAKELAIAQSSDAGSNEGSRRAVAAEVRQLYEEAVNIGNRKIGDRYVFGGFKTQTQPFDKEGSYNGDGGDIKIQTHKDSFVTMNMPGNRVFLGEGVGRDGVARSSGDTPRTVEELKHQKETDIKARETEDENEQNFIQTRGPASLTEVHHTSEKDPVTGASGINVFQTLKAFEIALQTNDKDSVQASLDNIDQAINQVVLARAEIGSRVNSVNNMLSNLQQSVVDNKAMISQMEDADMFQVVSDMNKSETALKATMETSGKLIQPSLFDFMR